MTNYRAIRNTFQFGEEVFCIESTRSWVRRQFINDVMGRDVYNDIMMLLTEIQSGNDYDNTDLIPDITGGYITITMFFVKWGIKGYGTIENPVDLTHEECIEDDDEYINIDIIAQAEFFDEIEALDIMNDEIGDFDGSITFDLEGNTLATVDSDYTLGSEDSYSM